MIRNVKDISGKVSLALIFTMPGYLLREFIVEDGNQAFKPLSDVETVDVGETCRDASYKTLPNRQSLVGSKNILALSSGEGGGSKSTGAVHVAKVFASRILLLLRASDR